MWGIVTSERFDDLFMLKTEYMMQDGRIDYGEFVAMMTKGNAGIGRRTMRNSVNISMRDVQEQGDQ